mmetsp:Transcript_20316/g.44328  ORF Transcript_20316/g.44328 Transcript_20316/m.44328 type:complete len:343 (-) Transcript_20316:211-1239(-)
MQHYLKEGLVSNTACPCVAICQVAEYSFEAQKREEGEGFQISSDRRSTEIRSDAEVAVAGEGVRRARRHVVHAIHEDVVAGLRGKDEEVVFVVDALRHSSEVEVVLDPDGVRLACDARAPLGVGSVGADVGHHNLDGLTHSLVTVRHREVVRVPLQKLPAAALKAAHRGRSSLGARVGAGLAAHAGSDLSAGAASHGLAHAHAARRVLEVASLDGFAGGRLALPTALGAPDIVGEDGLHRLSRRHSEVVGAPDQFYSVQGATRCHRSVAVNGGGRVVVKSMHTLSLDVALSELATRPNPGLRGHRETEEGESEHGRGRDAGSCRADGSHDDRCLFDQCRARR